MKIEEILNCFNKPNKKFPRKALNSAIKQQVEITPYLLSILEKTVNEYQSIKSEQTDYLFALFLLSKFREENALAPILSLASLPDPWPEKLLGDFITESLPQFLMCTCGDDISGIKKLIETPDANTWSRNAGLQCLVGLFRLGKLTREECIDYFRDLFHSDLMCDEGFVTHLVCVSSDIYPEELMEEINQVFKDNLVDLSCLDEDWVSNILARGKENCLNRYIYNNKSYQLIDDIEQEMWFISDFEENGEPVSLDSGCDTGCGCHESSSYFDNTDTYVRQTPKVGRNEPCICGSGKKYKKCCLQIGLIS